MYKVLIVEDEMLVRLGLKNSVNWAEYNMAVCADAQDGKSALEVYREMKPEVVVTDLRMPIMDGMELIRNIRQDSRKTRIVILTCLEEFDLVRQAMALGVSDYIPKLSMTPEDVEKILRKLKLELDSDSRDGGDRQNGIAESEAAKERVLKGFIFYSMYSETELDAYVKKYHLKFDPKSLLLCILEIDHFANFQSRYHDQRGDLIKISILNVLNELLHADAAGEVFFDDDEHYVMIFSPYKFGGAESDLRKAETFLTEMQNILRMYFDISVTYGLSKLGSGYASIKRMYPQAAACLKKKFFGGCGRIYQPDTPVQEEKPKEMIRRTLREPAVEWMIGEVLTSQGKDGTLQSLPMEESSVRKFFQDLTDCIHWRLNGAQPATKSSSEDVFEEQIDCSETLEELCTAFSQYAQATGSAVQERSSYSRGITEALEYLRNHYDQDISLNNLANRAGLSPNYFSKLFKEEITENYVEYLSKLRVEKAKNYLTDTNLKIYEIAQKVGFMEEPYFSRVFKRITGLSPNDYRNACGKGVHP